MKVLIAAADPVFLRMLELEFAERKIDCLPVSDVDAAAKNLSEARLAVVDAALLPQDDATRKSLLSAPREIVLFGYPEQIAQIPTQELTRYYVIVRPFAIDEFFSAFLFSSENSMQHEIRLRKRKHPADSLALDESLRTAYYKGEKIELTQREYALLHLLLKKRGTPVSREQAQAAVFGDSGSGTNVVDVYVNYLRAKIDNKFGIRLISTVRGCGYIIHE